MQKGQNQGSVFTGSGGVWVTNPFQNWNKAVEKMKAHASSAFHLRQVEAQLLASRGETVVYQLQHFGVLIEARTGKPSKHFFAALTTYANTTFHLWWERS